MIYHQLFERLGAVRAVKTGVIGVGNFATAIVTASRAIRRLDIVAVADRRTDAARAAFLGAGFAADDIVVRSSVRDALRAVEAGKRVVLEDPLLMMSLPVDVVVESTGIADAAAVHAWEAIRNGKHVIMVSKEADATVGPILKQQADHQGVVYSTGDGDQPGLLMGLLGWATELGFEIVSCGKARDLECVVDEGGRRLLFDRHEVPLAAEALDAFAPIPAGRAQEVCAARAAASGGMARMQGYDICELVLVANAFAGLAPDCETTVCPIARIAEMPRLFSPLSDGGVFRGRGIIDAVTCLRRPDEAGLGGGVFAVVAARDAYSRRIMRGKGMICNEDGTMGLVYRPYHLCGAETPISILCAGLLGIPTGAQSYAQRYDMVARAKVALKAGYRIASHADGYDRNLSCLIRRAAPVQEANPVPYYLAQGQALCRDVPAGELITAGAIEADRTATIWRLRQEQDQAGLRS